MGLRVFVGREQGCGGEDAILLDSVTGIVFGRRMPGLDYAEDFILWARDIRGIRDLRTIEPAEVVALQDIYAHERGNVVASRRHDLSFVLADPDGA